MLPGVVAHREKTAWEEKTLSVDLSDFVAQGVTLSGITATSTLRSDGTDSSATICGTTGSDGQTATVLAKGGTVGQSHLILLRVTCSDGQKLEPKIILEIV